MTRHESTRRRVRLTDQALVAVTAARHAAAADEREPSALDVLVALATAEGAASARLGGLMAGLTRLAERARHGSPRLAGVDDVLRWAGGAVTDRPLSTDDLLAATVELGGSELADTLDAAGVPPDTLATEPDDDPTTHVTETFGLDPAGIQGWPLPCARAIARARAAGGSATALAVAITVDPQLPAPVDPDTVGYRLRRAVEAADWRSAVLARDDDAGVDAVVSAAEGGGRNGVVDPLTLMQAARMAGGALPAELLAPADQADGA